MARARFKIAAGLLVLTALVGAGCGDDKSSTPDTQAPGSTIAAGTSSTTTLAPKDGGTLTHGVFSETAGLDPVVTFGGGATGTTEVGAIFDTLMRYDTDKKIFVPQIAESLASNADRRRQMAEAAGRMARPDAARVIVDKVLELAK